ncbi:MAG: UDP-3-O-(3-hydroxymyristoyl)glucosamine N-acyltransferase [Planctomycetota bacterium]|nr:UDP-3-O-(3-hydroxymyristoyl)glucosamine N-acyltransferase [Planctomycetota bacterium]
MSSGPDLFTRSGVLTSGALAARLGAELRGPGDVRIEGLATLETAGPGDLSFLRSGAFWEAWFSGGAGVTLVSRGAMDRAPEALPPGRALLIVADADMALIEVLSMLAPSPERPPGVHPTAVIDPSARIDPSASVGPHCFVGAGAVVGARSWLGAGVVLGARGSVGEDCAVHPRVIVQDGCVLHDRVILHAGVVIGTDGFGYRPAPGGKGLLKIPHLGNVVIESDVEIGSNSAIDRAKFGSTRIGAGTKIDNLVQIGHGCVIGRSCVICGTCGLAGSVTLGDGVTLAGGVGIADNVTIGARATIGARSAVMKDVPPGETWIGYPARPGMSTLRIMAALDRLPEVVSAIRSMSRQSE